MTSQWRELVRQRGTRRTEEGEQEEKEGKLWSIYAVPDDWKEMRVTFIQERARLVD